MSTAAERSAQRLASHRVRLLKQLSFRLAVAEIAVAALATAIYGVAWFTIAPWTFIPFTLAAPWVQRRYGSMGWAVFAINAPIFVIYAGLMVLTGGLEGLTPTLYITGPLVALTLSGPRLGVGWVIVSVLWLVVLGFWDGFWPFEPLLDTAALEIVNWGVCIAILIVAFDLAREYDHMRRMAADELTRSNTELLALVQELDAASEQLRAGAEQLRGGAEREGLLFRLRQAAAKGGRALSANRDELTELIEQIGAVTEAVETFHENSQAVGELLERIARISDRLDLMALNMGLEATRAGEAGQPFTLLARDMRRLAERVGRDSVQIRGTFERLEVRSKLALQAAAAGEELRLRGADNADALASVFGDVSGMVEDAADTGLAFSEYALGHLATLRRGIKTALSEDGSAGV